MDYLFSLNDKVKAKDRSFTRLDLVYKCTTTMAIQSFEGCYSKTFLITFWVVQYTNSEHILKNMIYPLCLTISLQMISRVVDQTRLQGSMQLLPEASYELGTSIRNDGLQHTM
jgi:hypothetical protein